MDNKEYVHYGCGHAAPSQWLNFDASPTLRIQKIPVLGKVLKKKLNTVFPENVRYGNIVEGLPVEANSCSGLYCSHVLEHLSLVDFRKALSNSYKILKPGGKFRCVVPDLEDYTKKYLEGLKRGDANASIEFLENDTLLGVKKRPRGLKSISEIIFGNAHHLWMWDEISLSNELKRAGFKNIRRCNFNDSQEQMFQYVENEGRFRNAVAIECEK